MFKPSSERKYIVSGYQLGVSILVDTRISLYKIWFLTIFEATV